MDGGRADGGQADGGLVGGGADRGLDERDLAGDPVAMFARWWHDAIVAGEPEPDAMALATASADAVPAVRFVLLKGFDERGWVFYTNASSAKGEHLRTNPVAALAFRWQLLGRQVRVAGPVAPVGDDESDAYFATRSRGSQLGAWASPQSSVLASRGDLEAAVDEVDRRFAGRSVPRPPHWHGWHVAPTSVEFWQGRSSRLHDRFVYQRGGGGGWAVTRLAP